MKHVRKYRRVLCNCCLFNSLNTTHLTWNMYKSTIGPYVTVVALTLSTRLTQSGKELKIWISSFTSWIFMFYVWVYYATVSLANRVNSIQFQTTFGIWAHTISLHTFKAQSGFQKEKQLLYILPTVYNILCAQNTIYIRTHTHILYI